MIRRGLVLLFCGIVSGSLSAGVLTDDRPDPDAPQWAEEVTPLPAFPSDKDLREFFVSELTAHKFLIDATSLSVGKDGVVRYTLVVRTSGGAVNISFEGMRCKTQELKIYATGRKDGTWLRARNSGWRQIQDKPINRQHAALWQDLFCPAGQPIRDQAEGLEALRMGKHPHSLKSKVF